MADEISEREGWLMRGPEAVGPGGVHVAFHGAEIVMNRIETDNDPCAADFEAEFDDDSELCVPTWLLVQLACAGVPGWAPPQIPDSWRIEGEVACGKLGTVHVGTKLYTEQTMVPWSVVFHLALASEFGLTMTMVQRQAAQATELEVLTKALRDANVSPNADGVRALHIDAMTLSVLREMADTVEAMLNAAKICTSHGLGPAVELLLAQRSRSNRNCDFCADPVWCSTCAEERAAAADDAPRCLQCGSQRLHEHASRIMGVSVLACDQCGAFMDPKLLQSRTQPEKDA